MAILCNFHLWTNGVGMWKCFTGFHRLKDDPLSFLKWGWVKTLVPSEPQNSWDLWMFIPLKIGIYRYWPIPESQSQFGFISPRFCDRPCSVARSGQVSPETPPWPRTPTEWRPTWRAKDDNFFGESRGTKFLRCLCLVEWFLRVFFQPESLQSETSNKTVAEF